MIFAGRFSSFFWQWKKNTTLLERLALHCIALPSAILDLIERPWTLSLGYIIIIINTLVCIALHCFACSEKKMVVYNTRQTIDFLASNFENIKSG